MKQQLPTWVIVLVLGVVLVGVVVYALQTTSVKRGSGKPPLPPPSDRRMSGPGMGGSSGAPPGSQETPAPPASKDAPKDKK